jgi:CHASE2 domain-containing sensor protein
MGKKRRNYNRNIMVGIMMMALVTICLVIVFWLWCLPPESSVTP